VTNEANIQLQNLQNKIHGEDFEQFTTRDSNVHARSHHRLPKPAPKEQRAH
jgi:hypothetical protein